MKKMIFCLAALLASVPLYSQQSATSAQANQPTYRVTMVPRTILAINYQNRTKTEIGFQGSPLLPLAKGEGDVESKNGRIAVDAKFDNLEPPQKFGAEYLTYVLWAITPEGKANNLGELLLDGKKSKLQATTTLQTFGLIVTAEPYYAVSDPSDAVVLENVVVAGTSGTLQQVNVNYMLFKRGIYSYNVEAATQSYSKSKVPLEVEEARNAVEIAKNSGAQQYAPDVLSKAEQSLTSAEAMLKKGDKRVIVQNSRDAVQNAAAAVQMTMQRKDEEQQAQERAAAAQRTADAQAQAQEAAAREQQEANGPPAGRVAAEASGATSRRQTRRLGPGGITSTARGSSSRCCGSKISSRTRRLPQQHSKPPLKLNRLPRKPNSKSNSSGRHFLQQFNRILPTTDTPRGLKANLADVLFATGKV